MTTTGAAPPSTRWSSGGCIISSATVKRSLLFSSVYVHSWATVEDLVILPGATSAAAPSSSAVWWTNGAAFRRACRSASIRDRPPAFPRQPPRASRWSPPKCSARVAAGMAKRCPRWRLISPSCGTCPALEYRHPGQREVPVAPGFSCTPSDYADMAAHLERHPAIRCTVNFVPVLLDQIE